MNRPLAAALGIMVALAPAPLLAQDASKLADLERKVDVLTQEIERLKLGDPSDPEGPAAKQSRVSIGGYGEFVYMAPSRRRQDADPSLRKKTADLLRTVLYFGYKFNDRIHFNSEVEFEHGGSGEGSETRGEAAVEQAYIDFKAFEPLSVRAGHLVVPLGLVNDVHEPTAFHGVNRPSVERFVIPSTWHENGLGVLGAYGPVSYRSYVFAGLHAIGSADPTTDGFKASNGVRGGRAGGSNTYAEDLAWASRVDVTPVVGVTMGGSLYIGQADHGAIPHTVPVTLWDAHGTASWRGIGLRALYAEGRIGNAAAVNVAQGFTDAAKDSVASRFFGGYAEASYDVLSLLHDAHGRALSVFARYERYDTQWRTPVGYAKDPANSRVEHTVGATYRPHPQVAVKIDQQWKKNQARSGVDQWNLGLSYIF